MNRLPILMYHNICKNPEDSIDLTISQKKLEEQFKYLFEQKFTTFHFSELESRTNIPTKSLVITFDDITENQAIYALPLLEKYNLKACFFIPFFYIGKTDSWNTGKEKIMTISQIRNLNPDIIELGFHSYKHTNYKKMSAIEIQKDLDQCYALIEKNNLIINPVLAYPYGSYNKKNPEKENMITILKNNNIKFGLRIGNRLNQFPFKKPYEIQRIDIKGGDSLLKFKLKLKFGKIHLF